MAPQIFLVSKAIYISSALTPFSYISFPPLPSTVLLMEFARGKAQGGRGVGCDGRVGGGSAPALLPVLQVQLRAINKQLEPTLQPIKRSHNLVACFL